LEKWVSGHFEQTGIEPKGLLIVNAFCDMPLDDRAEEAFPDQMRAYAARKSLCLLTSSQLLAILLACRAEPNCKERLVEEILDTVGVYAGQHLTDHLQLDAPTVSALSVPG